MCEGGGERRMCESGGRRGGVRVEGEREGWKVEGEEGEGGCVRMEGERCVKVTLIWSSQCVDSRFENHLWSSTSG